MEHKKERRKNLIRYIIPSTLGMLSVFVFTVVDGIFVGQGVGADGVGAVNIAYPFIMIFMAVEMLASIGGLTVMAIRKGRGDETGMNRAFMHSLTATVLVGTVFTVLAVVFTVPVSRMMGANGTFLAMVCDYIFWYGVFMLPCALNTELQGAVRNDGDPVLASVSTVTATMLNIIGDWLFVFPLQMGLKGAAIATGISQVVSLLICLSHFVRKKGVLRIEGFVPDRSLYRLIAVRGLPECVAQFNAPLVCIMYNYVLLAKLGDTAENAYAVICYVASFAIAVSIGVSEGLQPLFGNAYGEKNEEDLLWYRRAGLVISVAGAAVIYAALLFAGEPVCSLYGVGGDVMDLIRVYMPRYSVGFSVQAVNMIISAYLYSTTRTREALILNVLRSFVVDTLVIFLMPALFGVDSIWYAFAVYEAVMAVIGFAVMVRADKKGVITRAEE